MTRIAIVGGGQAGMPLALGLLDKGYDVTVATNRKPDEVRAGQVMSSQCIFDPALRIERDLGIDEWGDACPPVQGIGFAVPHPEQAGAKAIDWAAPLDRPAQAVDQRLKMPVWLERFAARGGNLLIQDVGVAELETLAQSHDLVILAAGKGEVVAVRARRRALAVRQAATRAGADLCARPGAHARLFARVLQPGARRRRVLRVPRADAQRPLRHHGVRGRARRPAGLLARPQIASRAPGREQAFPDTYLPWEGARAAKVELTDAKGILAGAFAPTIRKPVMTLPSGKLVFGLGDAVVVNDPVTGQGSNNATKAAKVYLDAILAHGDAPLHARMDGTDLRALLGLCQVGGAMDQLAAAAAPPHILQVLGAAQQPPGLAGLIANGFNHPPSYFPWWSDAAEAGELLKRHQAVARAA